jgi:putative nucleotidyltransferase with HDIG domain
MESCDQALYAAKELGRDRCVIFSSDVTAMLGGGRCLDQGEAEARLATLLALTEALDLRDHGTPEHCRAVGRYAAMTAQELGFDDAQVERVRVAGTLHDVGKVGISESILRKPGPLSEEERAEVQRHPELGAQILSGASFDDVREWVLAHHERPDGKGYPLGLRGDEIPIEASILAVADSYEAMTADRAYRPAMSDDAAREELSACAGHQFAPEVVEAFLRAAARQIERDRLLV